MRNLLASLAAGCAMAWVGASCSSPTFQCESDTQCGDAGHCEAIGLCSVTDETCPSSRRFGAQAGSVSNQCVDPDDVGGTESNSSTGTEPGPDDGATPGPDTGDSSPGTTEVDPATTATEESGDDTRRPLVLDCGSYAGVLVCDDFEDGISGGWTSPGRLELSAVMAHSGAMAADILVEPGERDMAGYSPDSSIIEGTLAVRSYVYFPASTVLDTWAIHFELLQIPTDVGQRMSLDFQDDDRIIMVNAVDNSSDSLPDILPRDRWFCLELRLVLGPGAPGARDVGSAQVRIDDKVVLDPGPVQTLPMLGYGLINIGALSSEENKSPIQMYIDDVVIATEPIGCD